MQIRERGASIHLIRTTYDPEAKRSKAEVVGRIPRRSLALPADVATKLSEAEMNEVREYVDRTRALEHLRRKVVAHGLPQAIDQAVEYAKAVNDEAERDYLQAMFREAIISLRRAVAPKVGPDSQ